MKIKSISAVEVLASGGYPTVQSTVELEGGTVASASVPYGASAGSLEASVLIDQDQRRYHGQGMLQAVDNVNQVIAPSLVGKEVINQLEIDRTMILLDGTSQKTKLGGNAILSVSLAAARAAALAQQLPLYEYIRQTFSLPPINQPLPQPMAVSIEGGKHADNSVDLQEFCLVATGLMSTQDSVRAILETYHELKRILKTANLSTNVGNEGAFAPSGIKSNEQPLKYLTQAIEQAGYQPKTQIGIAIDAAASEFYEEGEYYLAIEDKTLSADQLLSYYQTWLDKYPIISVEDMFDENDWPAWKKMNALANQHHILNVGDDLTVTNQKRLQLAIDNQAINAILIKLNQIGTLSETVQTCQLARANQLATVPSHRGGGETNDSFMVDLAVAVGAKYIKVGPTRGERVSKYNRLMEIDRQLHLD